jgi:hypothetical protein
MESPKEERKRKTKSTWELETEIKRTSMSWKDLEKMTLDKKDLERYGCGPMPPWGYSGKKKKNCNIFHFLDVINIH